MVCTLFNVKCLFYSILFQAISKISIRLVTENVAYVKPKRQFGFYMGEVLLIWWNLNSFLLLTGTADKDLKPYGFTLSSGESFSS